MKIVFHLCLRVIAALILVSMPVVLHAQEETKTLEDASRALAAAISTANTKPAPLKQQLLFNIYRAHSALGDFEKAVASVLPNAGYHRTISFASILSDAIQKRGADYAGNLLNSLDISPTTRDLLTANLASYVARTLDFDEALKVIPESSRRYYLIEQFGSALHTKDFAKAKRVLSFMDERERLSNSHKLAVSMVQAGLVDEALEEISALRDAEFHGIAAQIGAIALERGDIVLARRIASMMLNPPPGTPDVELSGRASSWGMIGGCPSTWRDEWAFGKGPGRPGIHGDCISAPPIAALSFAIALHKAGETELATSIVERFRRYAVRLADRLPEIAKEQYRLGEFTFGPPGAYITRTLAALVAIGDISSARLLAEAMFVSRAWPFATIAQSIGEIGNEDFLKRIFEYVPGDQRPTFVNYGFYGLLISGQLGLAQSWTNERRDKMPSHYSLAAAYLQYLYGRTEKSNEILDFIERDEHLFDSLDCYSWVAIGDGRKQMKVVDGAIRAYRRAFQTIVEDSRGDGWLAAYVVWQLRSLGVDVTFETAGVQLTHASTRQTFFAVVAELELMNGRFAEAEIYRSKLFDNRDSLATPANAPALLALDMKTAEELAKRGYLLEALRRNFALGDEYGQVVQIGTLFELWSRWSNRQTGQARPN